ncbi:MAG: acyl-CoA dehydratase activase-related protein [Desulfotomaculaceae bacterium]|nr:acyl-CoA dehydratase activase-related protein [Desulfotomaculaceae bacterium]
MRIGIPRALLYYYYYPMWKTFFEELGAEVVLSSPSTKGILAQGLKYAVDEVCLPVKMSFGHVLDLAGKVDYVFLPRMVSVEHRKYICPKFLGLPDMIRCLDGVPPLIDVNVNLYRKDRDLYTAVKKAGSYLTANQIKIWVAYRRSVAALQKYNRLLQLGLIPEEALAVLEDRVKNEPLPYPSDLNVAVIGHPYNIYDPYISMNLVGRLRDMGATVFTSEQVPEKIVSKYAERLPKRLFWTLGQRMIGAAFHYLDRVDISGMVHVAAFGCGPDSMTGDMIERQAHALQAPFLSLTLDEHTGEAGILTRIEAFLDMVRWRQAEASGL